MSVWFSVPGTRGMRSGESNVPLFGSKSSAVAEILLRKSSLSGVYAIANCDDNNNNNSDRAGKSEEINLSIMAEQRNR